MQKMLKSMIKYKEIKGIKVEERSKMGMLKKKDEEKQGEKKKAPPTRSFWSKVAALMKDKQSLFRIKFSGEKEYRNRTLEVAIVMATSHDEFQVDYKNANRVFEWIKASPTFLRPFFWFLTKRIEKTHSWVVALKALMLVHGVFCTKAPGLGKIGRLPFDLSNFHDRYSDAAHAWAFTLLVRSYYAFLDHKCNSMSHESDEVDEDMRGLSVETSISRLQRLQTLLELLLQIKPIHGEAMGVILVLDAMDCVLIEIFEVYSAIREGVAAMLCIPFSLTKAEAAMALRVLETVTAQNGLLSDYFHECRRMGVANAMELPAMEQQIPEEDISDIKGIISQILRNGEENPAGPLGRLLGYDKGFKGSSQTIVTQDWVVFNDEMEGEEGVEKVGSGCNGGGRKKELSYSFGRSLDVGGRGGGGGGGGRRRDFKALWLVPHDGGIREHKMERDLKYF